MFQVTLVCSCNRLFGLQASLDAAGAFESNSCRYLARIESRHSIGAAPTPANQIVEQLTERETAVLRYLPTSMSQREFASGLYVSFNTVKTHCVAIYRKLGVGDRKAAVQAARAIHLL